VIQSHPSIQILLMINSEPFICFDQILTLRSPPFGCPMGLGLSPPHPMRGRDTSSPQEKLSHFPKAHQNQSKLLTSQARGSWSLLKKIKPEKWNEERERGLELEEGAPGLQFFRSGRPTGRQKRQTGGDEPPSRASSFLSLIIAFPML